MAFRTPTFNLSVNIWRGAGGGPYLYTAPTLTVSGNLSPGKRVTMQSPAAVLSASRPTIFMELLLPAGTAISPGYNGNARDIVEVPAGSLRVYHVMAVDDSAKGFGNEYRIAFLEYSTSGGVDFTPTFPAPDPLP